MEISKLTPMSTPVGSLFGQVLQRRNTVDDKQDLTAGVVSPRRLENVVAQFVSKQQH